MKKNSMKNIINEVKRMQKIAGILKESEMGTDFEEGFSGDVLSRSEQNAAALITGMMSEDQLDEFKDIAKTIKIVRDIASKGLLSVALASSLLVSCGKDPAKSQLKREIENAKKVQKLDFEDQKRLDSTIKAWENPNAQK